MKKIYTEAQKAEILQRYSSGEPVAHHGRLSIVARRLE